MLERLKSPVVWGAILATIYTQVEALQSQDVDGWKITLATLTVLITAFAAINNPTDRDNL